MSIANCPEFQAQLTCSGTARCAQQSNGSATGHLVGLKQQRGASGIGEEDGLSTEIRCQSMKG